MGQSHEIPPASRAKRQIPVSSVRNDYPVEETIIKAAGPLVGLAVLVANHLRERRKRRAAARVVLSALREALDKTHEPQMHPARPVIVPFATYTKTWSDERKALAEGMTQEELDAAQSAFAALASLQKSEKLGIDLRNEVFDGLLDAAGQCEKARRVVWKHTQSPPDRVERWIRRRISELRVRHEHRRLGREVAKIRKQRSPQPMMG
jgi:hypothetical protein